MSPETGPKQKTVDEKEAWYNGDFADTGALWINAVWMCQLPQKMYKPVYKQHLNL